MTVSRNMPAEARPSADPLDVLRDAVEAFVRSRYPGTTNLAVCLDPGPGLPPVVLKLLGDLPGNVVGEDLMASML